MADNRNRVAIEISAEAAQATASLNAFFANLRTKQAFVTEFNKAWSASAQAATAAVGKTSAVASTAAASISQRFAAEFYSAWDKGQAQANQHVFAAAAQSIAQARQLMAYPLAGTLGVPMADLAKSAKAASDGMKAANGSAKGIGQSAEGAAVGIWGLSGGLRDMIVPLAELYSVHKIADFFKDITKEAISTGTELKRLGQATGMSVETLGQMKDSSAQVGLSLSEVRIGFRSFSAAVVEASKGGNAMADAFKSIGITQFFDAKTNNLKTTEEMFLATADAMSSYQDGMQKSRIAQELFGRDGQRWIPVLNAGAKAIKEQDAAFSTSFADRASEFTSNMVELGDSVEKIGISIASALLPALIDMAKATTGVVNSLVEWTRISPIFQQTMINIESALRAAYATMIQVGGYIGVFANSVGAYAAGIWEVIKGLPILGFIGDLAKAFGEMSVQMANIFDGIRQGLKGIAEYSTGNIAKGWIDMGEAVDKLKTPARAAKKATDDLTGSLVKLFTFNKGSFIDPEKWAMAKSIFKDAFDEATKGYAQIDAAAKRITGGAGKTPEAVAAGLIPIPKPEQTREQVDAMWATMAEIQKAYDAETLSKRAQLAKDYELDRQKIEQTVKSGEMQAEALYKARKTYQAKVAKLDQEQELVVFNRQTDLSLKGIQDQRQELDANWWLTDSEKRTKRLELMQKEVDLDSEGVRILQEKADMPGISDDAKLKYQTSLYEAQKKQQDAQSRLNTEQKQPDPSNFGADILVRVAQLRREWGNMAVNMANILTNTVTSAVQGLSNALTSIITGAQSAAAAFGQFALQMATQFISSIIQMVLMAHVAIPILTALGVLSGGVIPEAGAATTIASVGAAVAATSAYASGGPIRQGTGPRADDVIIRASRGEWIVNAGASGYYGDAIMNSLNNRRIPRSALEAFAMSYRPTQRRAFADGGAVAGRDVNVQAGPVQIGILNNQSELKSFLESSAGQGVIVNIVRRNSGAIGFRR